MNEERTWKCLRQVEHMTQILHNGQTSHGGDRQAFDVMTSPNQ